MDAMPPGAPRFLVVEDEALVAASLSRAIHRRGLGECVVTATADEARTSLRDTPFTALLIDVMLHGCPSGLEVLAEARAGGHALTPAIVLSGSNAREHVNRASELDAKYFVKPVEMARLVACLRDTISLERRLSLAIVRMPLTEALGDVVKRTALGQSKEAIAEARRTTPRTIENQIVEAMRRTRQASLRDLIADVLRNVARSR